MPVSRVSIAGSPYLGVCLRVSDRGAIVPPSAPPTVAREVERMFGVPAIRSTVLDSEIVGALLAWNSFGAVVGEEVDDAERRRLEAAVPVSVVKARQNALGNNVLANDRGAVVHPSLTDVEVASVAEALRVPARRGTVAGLGTVGMAGAATNRGVVVHPRTTETELQVIAETLQVPAHRSTANFGVPIVGACVVANSRALLVGSPTTPVEIAHLQEGFQIFD